MTIVKKSKPSVERKTFSSEPRLANKELRSGHDPSRLFHRSVNKRYVPDYYEIIKEPMALSILKARINKREYKQFSEFVRDCALVRHCTGSD